eukprot:s9726_g1.t1
MRSAGELRHGGQLASKGTFNPTSWADQRKAKIENLGS